MSQLNTSHEESGSSERVSELFHNAISRPLRDLLENDSVTLEQHTPHIYEELRQLARSYMQRELSEREASDVVQEVVQEAYLRLSKTYASGLDRTRFFALSARVMRRVLVDHAKARDRAKLDMTRTIAATSLEAAAVTDSSRVNTLEASFDVIALDDALALLATQEPRLSQVVELHYFGGLTYAEISEVVSLSESEVHRDLRLARAWLLNEISSARSTDADEQLREDEVAEQQVLRVIDEFHERLKSVTTNVDSVLARILRQQRAIDDGTLKSRVRELLAQWVAKNPDTSVDIADLFVPVAGK
jgi:RNA polymerase sigma factor (TIGR02999 family)